MYVGSYLYLFSQPSFLRYKSVPNSVQKCLFWAFKRTHTDFGTEDHRVWYGGRAEEQWRNNGLTAYLRQCFCTVFVSKHGHISCPDGYESSNITHHSLPLGIWSEEEAVL